MTTLAAIIDDILVREGGFVARAEDKGGPTNRGITQATLSEWRSHPVTAEDVRMLGDEEARAIYRDRYIVRPGFAELPDPLRALVVDCGVNHGTTRATQWLQTALRLTADGIIGGSTVAAMLAADAKQVYRKVLASRVRYYGRLVTDNPKQAVFSAGWANRAASFVEACP